MPKGKPHRISSQPAPEFTLVPPEPAPAPAPGPSLPVKLFRRPRTPRPLAPPPPSPAVLALQDQVLKLVSQRDDLNYAIAAGRDELEEAQLRLRRNEDRLKALEVEIQYRLALSAQMSGQRSMETSYGPEAPIYIPPSMPQMPGAIQPLIQPRFSSIPAPPPSAPRLQVIPADGINQGSAEEFRGI